MSKLLQALVGVAWTSLAVVAPAAAETFLVKAGKADAEIVIADSPPRTVRFAAEELQTYVRKISGARLEIVTAPTDTGPKDAGPVPIYVGESKAARQASVTAEGLKRDAFRMVSGDGWLALVGNDVEFVPIEPWARNHGQWAAEKDAEWKKLAGHPWRNPIGRRIYRDHNKHLDVWSYDIPIISVMPHDGFNHCQCERCGDQVTLDRGPSGRSSDYVWDFVVRVANELARTHPDKKVFCGAYSSYRLPPLKIDQLPDNVLVQITNGRPIRELDDEVHQYTAELREQWLAKSPNPLSLTLNYTPFTNRGAYRPQYWPHVAARGIQAAHKDVWREDVWLSSGKGGLHYPGMAHLNPYVISRFWWNPDQDVDALLEEYYQLFYGPAAEPMGAFIEFCEKNYADLGSDPEVAATALELFDRALAAAPPDSVYGRRIAMVDEFLVTLRNRATQIDVPRPEGLPEYRLIDMGKDKWRDARDTFTMDGKLDEPFWQAYYHPRPLRELRTGKQPKHQTRFMGRWWNDSLYFGIRCEFDPDEPPVIGSRPFQAKQAALESGKGTSLPWYFNLYRKRSGTGDVETTAFSPLGPDAKSFHVPLRFSRIYVR